MRRHLDDHFEIYWDLRVGVKGDANRPEARTTGESLNTRPRLS